MIEGGDEVEHARSPGPVATPRTVRALPARSQPAFSATIFDWSERAAVLAGQADCRNAVSGPVQQVWSGRNRPHSP
jgi:hypothetical protein